MARLKNLRHEKFARAYVSETNGNGTQAYLQAYPASSKSAANANSSRLINTDNVKARITTLLEDKTGSRLDVLLSDLIELKQANKDIIIDKVMHEVRDNPVRLESVKTLLKLHGLLGSNSTSVSDNRSVTFNVSGSDVKDLGTIIARLEKIETRDDKISGRIE